MNKREAIVVVLILALIVFIVFFALVFYCGDYFESIKVTGRGITGTVALYVQGIKYAYILSPLNTFLFCLITGSPVKMILSSRSK